MIETTAAMKNYFNVLMPNNKFNTLLINNFMKKISKKSILTLEMSQYN